MQQNQPFTRLQAKAISEAYQYLLKDPFYGDGGEQKGLIECISIAPYDEINKWIFIQHYKDYRCAGKALEFYHVPYFNVTVISDRIHTDDFAFADLVTYLHRVNKPVNLPEFSREL